MLLLLLYVWYIAWS